MELLTPGVYFAWRQKPPVLRPLRSDIAAFIGLAERGPLQKPVVVESWRQFQAVFGGFLPYAHLAYTVKGFFDNGGRTCFIVRVAGPGATTAGFTLANAAGRPVWRLEGSSPGRWGNEINFTLQTLPERQLWSLRVALGTEGLEYFPELAVDPEGRRRTLARLNETDDLAPPSRWLRLQLLAPEAAAPELLPDAAASGLVQGRGWLSGGQDDLASLTMADFLGPSAAPEPRGLAVLERLSEISLLCLPDLHCQPAPPRPTVPPPPEPPTDPCLFAEKPLPLSGAPVPAEDQPPWFSMTEILRAQQQLLDHCEGRRDRLVLLETPLGPSGRALTPAEVRQWRESLTSPRGYGVLYHPWIKVLEPLAPPGARLRAVPPCGHLAGIIARLDQEVGVHRAPANVALEWAEDLTAVVDDKLQAVFNPLGINCLRAFPGRGLRIFGARTLSDDPDRHYLNVRRLLIMLTRTIELQCQWSVFEPHTESLRLTLTLSLSGLLSELWRQGALVGATPAEAFFVKCDAENNPPAVVDQGNLIVEIGVAPARPAEFIVLQLDRVGQEWQLQEGRS